MPLWSTWFLICLRHARGVDFAAKNMLIPLNEKLWFSCENSFSCFILCLSVLQVPKTALQTPFKQGTVQDLAKRMLQLSRDGLARRGNHEEPFLEPLQEIADVSQKCCAA